MHLSVNGVTSNNNLSPGSDSSSDSLESNLAQDQDVIQSIAKLQLSRQDNPTLQKHGYDVAQPIEMHAIRAESGAGDSHAHAHAHTYTHAQVHSSSSSISGHPRRKMLPPLNIDVQKCKTPPAEHNLLIRSPPPMLKTGGNFSPILSRAVRAPSGELNTRAQVEDDLADILASQASFSNLIY